LPAYWQPLQPLNKPRRVNPRRALTRVALLRRLPRHRARLRHPTSPTTGRQVSPRTKLAKCHEQLMASRTSRVYGAAPSSRHSNGGAMNLRRRNTMNQSGPSSRDAAQQRQFDLRTEPTVTPPGEKTTDSYNTFWRDGFWYKVPMTSLRTSQVVDPPNGRLPPLTPAAREQLKRADDLLNRPPTGPEDRPLSSRCIRPNGGGPAFVGLGPGGQESTFEIIQSPQAVVVRGENLRSQLIYLDGRPRPPASVHLETGAARALGGRYPRR
jgi:hypothetical protein